MAEFLLNKSQSTDKYIQGKIVYSSTQSTSSNTSSVTATLYVRKGHPDMKLTVPTGGSWAYSLTVNGEKVTGSTSYTQVLESWVKLTSKTVTVNHNNNGSKSIAISGSVTAPVGTSFQGHTSSGSKDISLPTIPRASSITSAGNVTLGNKCSVKWTPLASSFAYKVKLSCGGITHTSDYITPGSTSAHTYAATMSISYWAGAMPKSYTGTCTATLYTYTSSSSSSAIGSDTATFTLTLPKNTDTSPKVSFATPTLVDGWNGYYIQGKSKCTLSATFATGAGSSISSCSISGTGLSEIGTGTSLSGTTSALTKSGTLTYTASVTDGRTSSSATQSIYVYPYAEPTLSISAARTSVSGAVKITYKAACSSINSKNNLVSLKIYRKLSSESGWPSSPTKTVALSSTSVTNSVTLNNYDQTSSYDFRATVTDTYGSTSAFALAAISSEFRILNISADKQRLSIGKMAADNGAQLFDCAMPARFLNGIEFSNDNNSIYGSLEVDYNESGNNIVYIRNGQNVEGGASMALAVHKSSVYVPGDANDGLVNLGSGSRKWNQIYAANGAILTSDRKVKTDISGMTDIQQQLFDKLKPVTYKFKNGKSDRTHYGFVSQDVEASLNELGLTGKDFAGFCKDMRVDDNGNVVLDENGQKIYDYSLRYSEFIALNTYMIQKLQAENLELREEIQTLKAMVMKDGTNNAE